MNYHEVLGVGQNASIGDIKQAFRKAAKEYHPDISDSPEAAEAFQRIKEAHDALLKEAEMSRESTSATTSAAHAATASASHTASTAQSTNPTPDDSAIKHTQELDELARQQKAGIFGKQKESEELRRHRKKLKTNERRLKGLY